MFCPQDLRHPQWPKEKLHPDSSNNNNENSVSRDFDSVDGNSNLGARSQRQRLSVQNAKRKLDKAKAQSMMGKSANQILKFSPVLANEPGRNHSRPSAPRASTRAPSVSSPPPPTLQPSNQEKKKKAVALLPPSVETKKEQLQCEVSGKEAISALSRARSRECRQQIVEVYCKHKQGALMPEKVPRYCPLQGESCRSQTAFVSEYLYVDVITNNYVNYNLFLFLVILTLLPISRHCRTPNFQNRYQLLLFL